MSLQRWQYVIMPITASSPIRTAGRMTERLSRAGRIGHPRDQQVEVAEHGENLHAFKDSVSATADRVVTTGSARRSWP